MAIPERTLATEVQPDFKSTDFAAILTAFAGEHGFDIYIVLPEAEYSSYDLAEGYRKVETPHVLGVKDFGRGGDGIFLITNKERDTYRVGFHYDYPRRQTHYTATITSVDGNAPIEEILAVEDETQDRLVLGRLTKWNNGWGRHNLSVESEINQAIMYGEDEILTELFESLPRVKPV